MISLLLFPKEREIFIFIAMLSRTKTFKNFFKIDSVLLEICVTKYCGHLTMANFILN